MKYTLESIKKIRDLHIANGDTLTNFGWLTQDQLQKGFNWGAIRWSYKDKGILGVCYDKGNKTMTNFSCWLAYIECERKIGDWYKHLDRMDEINNVSVKSKFKELTGIRIPLEGEPLWLSQHEGQ